jgi:hypothetical protein
MLVGSSATGELPEAPMRLHPGAGSFDCVVARIANDNSAQDDSAAIWARCVLFRDLSVHDKCSIVTALTFDIPIPCQDRMIL